MQMHIQVLPVFSCRLPTPSLTSISTPRTCHYRYLRGIHLEAYRPLPLPKAVVTSRLLWCRAFMKQQQWPLTSVRVCCARGIARIGVLGACWDVGWSR